MNSPSESPPPFLQRRPRVWAKRVDPCMAGFFGANAMVALLVLGLITVFLFREGYGFFGQYRRELQVYRQAGLEYVDFLRQQERDHTALTRYLFDVRMRAVRYWTEQHGLTAAETEARLGDFDAFAEQYGDAVLPIRDLLNELGELAAAIKAQFAVQEDEEEARQQLTAAGRLEEAERAVSPPVDVVRELEPLLTALPLYREANSEFARALEEALAQAPALPEPALQHRLDRLKVLTRDYVAGFPQIEAAMEAWDYRRPVPFWASFTAFLFGREWLTASFWQDWYGVLPLLTGSLLVSFVALSLAVPLGIGAALYVNQLASSAEQRFIKPAIEFISAVPSVVLGFFGIVVLGEALRALSQVSWLAWMPGFPMGERLNALTAGCLLALLAVPTIFTLAEDALGRVPQGFKEGSLALGATRLQTILRIIVPTAISGLLSAVLLGFGRVIGETMVVLLCAGNRIAIPDFSAGLAVFTQPVHTMTGIIAQEMGEVVRGKIHYRALFVVGLGLFFLSLAINYIAQTVARRYRLLSH